MDGQHQEQPWAGCLSQLSLDSLFVGNPDVAMDSILNVIDNYY
jgi:hypothetical protein